VSVAVMGFFFLYLACFAVLAALLSLTGLDTLTALSGAASAISNVGPGLGLVIGPEGNYASLSDVAYCAGPSNACVLAGVANLFFVNAG